MSVARRRLLWALAISLALHFLLLIGARIRLPQPAPEKPLTVKLVALPQAVPPKKIAPPKPHPKPVHTPAPKAETAPPPTAEPLPAPTPIETARVEQPAPPAAQPPAPPPKPLTPLPKRIEIAYTLYKGEQKLNVGRLTTTWQINGTQYTLTSIAEATGLFSLFVRGALIQVSRGELASEGLKPGEFWIQRGQSGNRTDSASFDWAGQLLRYGPANEQRTQPLASGTQDVLSVLFQLALTAPHSGTLDLAVTNGRKFDHYRYRVEGEEMLETPLGTVKAEHLAKADPDGDRLDVWLAADYHYLPVRLKITDKKGDTAEQIVQSISGE